MPHLAASNLNSSPTRLPRKPAKSQRDRLNPQQARFCREYVLDYSAAKAAERAGYSKHSAAALGCQLLNMPKIQQRIEQLDCKIAEKTEFLITRTVRELCRVAFSDPRDLLGEDGKLLPAAEWPEDLAHAVASYELDKAGNIIKIRFWSKTDALAMLGKYTGILREESKDAGDGVKSVDVNITYVQAPRRSEITQPEYYAPRSSESPSATVEVKLLPKGSHTSDSNTP